MRNSIKPFPSHIDRDSFGNWLSGFADGEAHFGMRLTKCKAKHFAQPVAFFRIAIRDDDIGILELIQSFLACGNISRHSNARSLIKNAKPYASLQVSGRQQLVDFVIPHFLRHPLRSKKLRDFSIWHDGINVMSTVADRPGDQYRRVANGQRLPKWTDEERSHFQSLVEKLRRQRVYVSRI